MKGKHFQNWWAVLPVPKGSTLFMMLVYILFIAHAAANIVSPGRGVDLMADILRYLLTAGLLFGGTLGFVACSRGLWLLERPAILTLAGVYMTYVFWVFGDFDGDEYVSLQTALRMSIIMTFLGKRYMQIRWAMLDPQRKLRGGSDSLCRPIYRS